MSESRAGRVPSLGQKVVLVLFGLGLLLVVLGLIEGALVLLHVGDPDRFADPFVGFEPGRSLFVKETGGDGVERYVTSEPKLAFFNEQEFPADKGKNTYRIFALGGSTTAGRPYDAAVAFPAWLERYSKAAEPEREWEVVNAGGISYASYRIVVLMKELVRYQPDLFVVYTGHNEFLEERTYGDILQRPRGIRRLQAWLAETRTYTLARHLLREPEPQPKNETVLAAEVHATLDDWTGFDDYRRTAEFKQATLQHFEFNLRQMVALARSAGAEIVFVTPISNLRDFSPFESEYRSGLQLEDRIRLDARMEEGRRARTDGDLAAAEASFGAVLAVDGEYALAHYELGRTLLAAGQTEAAKVELVLARDLDVAPLRAPSSFVDALRRVAREEGVELIDLLDVVERESQRRFGTAILGNGVLLDHVHPDMWVHSLLGELLLDWLARQGIAHPDAGWTETKRQEIYERVRAGLDPRYYATRDLNLAKVLGWSGKLAEAEEPLRRAAVVLTDDPEVFLHLGTLYARTGRLEEARAAAERAVELAPDLPAAQFNLGVVCGHLGEVERGIAALRRSLELRPAYPEATYNLGLLLRRAGRLDEAVATLEKAARLRPEASEVELQLARTYRLQSRLDEALAAVDRALELTPGDAECLTERGTILAELERFDEAEASLLAALDRAPRLAEAHYGLGLLLSREGRTGEARAAYERAIESDPRHVRALNNLGILSARGGEKERARALLESAVEIDPDYAEAQFNLAVVLDATGHPEASLERLHRALELEPDNGRFHLALGALLAHLGKAAEARGHLQAAAEQGVEGASEALARLE